MGVEPLEAGLTIRVPSGEREVAIGSVSAGETWSFSAAGEWRTGFVWCGADGYRNFLYDALKFAPRARGEARLKLIGRFRDEPDSAAFPIGAGCTRTFARSGELVVFANDLLDGYADNRGAVTLTIAPRRRRARAEDLGRRRFRLVGRYRRALPSHGRRAGHRRLRPRRLGNPSLHAARARPRPRRRRGRTGPRWRSPSQSGFCSSPFRPGAGRASSLPRTTEPTAPAGGRAGSSNGGRGCWPSCLLPRPVSRSWSVSSGTRPSA